jgi:uroporphyrinogen-III synthase
MAGVMTILITRAMPEAAETAQQIRALGHIPILAPLHVCESLTPTVPLEEPARLIATSARAFHGGIMLLPAWYALPLHVVGAATARAAQEAGFTNLIIAGGDAQSLIQDVRVMAQAGARLLYMAGEPRKPDVEAALGQDFMLETQLHYRMMGIETLPETARSAFETGLCHAILHFSAETARHLITLTRKARMEDQLAPIQHLCLSPAIADVIRAAGLPHPPRLSIAEKPDMPSLLALLGERN